MLEPGGAKTSELMEPVDPIFYSAPVAAANSASLVELKEAARLARWRETHRSMEPARMGGDSILRASFGGGPRQATCKFWLNPLVLARDHGFAPHELNRIRRLIETHMETISNAWDEHCGHQ